MRGLLSAAFLVLSILLTIGLGSPARDEIPRLAGVAGTAVLLSALFQTSTPTAAFGSFVTPLALSTQLALTLIAMSLTGGFRSDLGVLLLIDIVLTARAEGRPAARFLCLGTVAGLCFLVWQAGADLAAADALKGLAFRLLAPAAVLVAVESLSAKTGETGETGAGEDEEGDRSSKVRRAKDEAVRRERARAMRTGAAPLSLSLSEDSRLAEPASAAGREARAGAPGAPPSFEETPRLADSEPARLHPRDLKQELLHDLKSPLSVIRVYADLIAEGAQRGEPPSPDHLASLGNEIGLMESLVGVPPRKRAPSAPAPQGLLPQRLDLVRILSSLAESYRLAYGERVRMEFIADRPEIPIVADPVALQRAFRNVLDNAVKYTPPGGQVRIRASVVSQHSFVVISDTGIGMTPEEQHRAFEYSYRGAAAKASGAEGRGLGLSVSRELLEANGGKISLLSEPGHGLEVTIMFPILKESGF